MQNNCSVRYKQNGILGGFYEKKDFCIRIMPAYMFNFFSNSFCNGKSN